jgi:hypothetical protein
LPFPIETVRELLTLAHNGPHALLCLTTAAECGRGPVELWEVTAPFRDNPPPMKNAPSGLPPYVPPRPVKTLAEYEEMIALGRKYHQEASEAEAEALEWLGLIALSYANAKRTRKSDPANFRYWATALSLAASQYAKTQPQDI